MAIHESQSLSFEMQLGRSRALPRRCSRRCSSRRFGAQPAFERRQPVPALHAGRAGLHPRRRRRGHVSGARDPALRDRARARSRARSRSTTSPRCGTTRCRRCSASTRAATSRTAACRTSTGRPARSATSRATRSARCTRRSGSRRCARATPDARRATSRAGDFAGVFDWLRANIWEQASRYPTDELCRRASGGPLIPRTSRRTSRTRYLG